MKLVLTDRSIRKLVAPEPGRLEVLDAKQPGLALRVTQNGKKTWTVVWHQGRQTRRHAPASIRPSRWRPPGSASAPCQYRAGRRPRMARIAKRVAPTVAALAADFVERHAKPHKRSWEADQWTLDVDILPVLGRMQASDVQRRHVRAFDDIIENACAAEPHPFEPRPRAPSLALRVRRAARPADGEPDGRRGASARAAPRTGTHGRRSARDLHGPCRRACLVGGVRPASIPDWQQAQRGAPPPPGLRHVRACLGTTRPALGCDSDR